MLSGPKSRSSKPSRPASLARARLTRLFTVPTAQPHTWGHPHRTYPMRRPSISTSRCSAGSCHREFLVLQAVELRGCGSYDVVLLVVIHFAHSLSVLRS